MADQTVEKKEPPNCTAPMFIGFLVFLVLVALAALTYELLLARP